MTLHVSVGTPHPYAIALSVVGMRNRYMTDTYT
jgi:hypothetical protein